MLLICILKDVKSVLSYKFLISVTEQRGSLVIIGSQEGSASNKSLVSTVLMNKHKLSYCPCRPTQMFVVSMVNSAWRIDPLSHGLLLSVARPIWGLCFPYPNIFIPLHFSFPTFACNLVTVCEMAVKAFRSLLFFFLYISCTDSNFKFNCDNSVDSFLVY